MTSRQPLSESSALRAIVATALLAVVAAVLGVWLYAHDRVTLGQESLLRVKRTALEVKTADAEQKIQTVEALVLPEQEKVAQTEKIIRQLEELQSTWDLVSRNRAQQKANSERLENMRKLNANTVARVADLQQQVAQAKWESDRHEIERTKIDSQLRVMEASKLGGGYRLRHGWILVRSWICFGVALYLIGPVLVPKLLELRRRREEGVTVGGRDS